jgi:hypothetical protein
MIASRNANLGAMLIGIAAILTSAEFVSVYPDSWREPVMLIGTIVTALAGWRVAPGNAKDAAKFVAPTAMIVLITCVSLMTGALITSCGG